MNAVTPTLDGHAPAKNCPNCEAELNGHFCANCGQEAILHHASTREFLHEFIGHYVALEGKLWGTLGRLLFRPGALTNEYIRGRRVRFVQPLRIYLTFSLLFFALLKFTGSFEPAVEDDPDSGERIASIRGKAQELAAPRDQGSIAAEAAVSGMKAEMRAKPREPGADPVAVPAPAASASASASAAASAAPAASAASASQPERQRGIGEISVEPEEVNRFLSRWPTLQHKLHAFEGLTSEQRNQVFKDGFYHYAPYVIFCLMPVFALLLKLLYLGSGRRYGEHMLFALHTNAFAYFVFSVMLFVHIGIISFVLWCWLLAYMPWAMRRVYHRSRFGTFCRWLLLMFLYSTAIFFGILGSAGMGIMTIH